MERAVSNVRRKGKPSLVVVPTLAPVLCTDRAKSNVSSVMFLVGFVVQNGSALKISIIALSSSGNVASSAFRIAVSSEMAL